LTEAMDLVQDRLRIEYTGYVQKNVADSKVNKKFISHLTRAQQQDKLLTAV